MSQAMPANVTVEQCRNACVESYATYSRLMQDDGYFDDTHEKLCIWTQAHIERLERQVAVRGTCTGKLAYVMPRGSLKSTIVTKRLNEWLVIRRYYKFNDDTTRCLLAGNTHTNSKKKLAGIRGTFDSVDLFKALFSKLLPTKKNKWSDEAASINRKSAFDEETFEVGSLKTKLTGRHYNIITEDDTTAPDADEMEEDVTRPSTETIQKAIGFHQASMPLFVPKGFRLSIVVSTRWAMIDLISKIQDEDYHVFDVPAEIDGEPVFQCFYDKETLAIIKQRVGDYMYSCLYLNKPLDDSLRIFKSTDMFWVDKADVPNTGWFTIACDPAISETDDACETAITVRQTVFKGDKRYQYWHEDVHGYFTPKQTTEMMVKLADKYHTSAVPVRGLIIETVAYQDALRFDLVDIMNNREADGLRTYHIYKAKRGNKKVRIEAMQPAFQANRIYFVRGAISDQTESQLLQWPMGRLVDVIDSWSMHHKIHIAERPPLPEEPQTPESEFEQAYNEVTQRKLDAEFDAQVGLGCQIVEVGCGLTPTGEIYYD